MTGGSEGSGTRSDYATIKYNSAGAEQWAARYNGTGNPNAHASALAVDISGNVYVTGTSEGSGTEDDYATVKYNSAGAEQWVARYNSPENTNDWATALSLDISGNVYVTGMSEGSGTEDDYATVKYNSAGAEQWVARYDGSGNSTDWARALAVDGSGNVYVTGTSWGLDTWDDYVTVKYSSEGVEQWVTRYNGPENDNGYAWALNVESSGNVYVTGSARSDTVPGGVTVKYNSAGVEQWVAGFDGTPFAFAVDVSGNVYVTGTSWGLDTTSDYATVKYNSEGVEQWVARYNGMGNLNDEANALAVDAYGNVYITGTSVSSDTKSDYATVKYNYAGVQQWVTHYNGPGNLYDEANALAMDAFGNVYVTGISFGSVTGNECVTVKYNSAGVEQWVARYNGTRNSWDMAHILAVDASGNVYVTGTSAGDGWSVYTTIKYVQTPVSVEKEESGNPSRCQLAQNYPNPFNPSTTIKYELHHPAHVTLRIYNTLNQEVATLVDQNKPAGIHTVQFDGSKLPTGIYFCRLQAGGYTQTRKLMVLR